VAGREFLRRQVIAAAQMGHVLDLVEKVPGRFRVVCSCGYSSTNRRSKALAISAGMHHVGQVAGDSSRNGATPKISESA